MKRLFLLLLIPSLSFGAVTEANVDDAIAANDAIFTCYRDMRTYLLQRKAFFRNGAVATIQGSTVTIPVPQNVIDDFVDVPKYQVKKGCYIPAYNSFP